MKRDGNSALTPSFQHTKAARGTEFWGNQSVTPLAPARDISIRKAACHTLKRKRGLSYTSECENQQTCWLCAQAFTQVYMHLLLKFTKAGCTGNFTYTAQAYPLTSLFHKIIFSFSLVPCPTQKLVSWVYVVK